jgi:membrane-bound serine protease (ClpP class)
MVNFLIDPNVSYFLLVLGLMLAVLALFSPGTGILEIGAVALLVLAGYGIINIPINLWALIVLVVGIFPFLLALRRSRQIVFLVLALLALVVGSVFLFRTPEGAPAVNPFLAGIVSLVAVLFLWFVGRKGIEAIMRMPDHSLERLIGQVGIAQSDVFQEGSVHVSGEVWSARSEVYIAKGNQVRIIGREGLMLIVEPLEKSVQ